jgi:hypothetical protein
MFWTWLSFTSLTMGPMMRGYRPGFGTKSGWLLWSKVMETSDHLRYSGVVGLTAMTSRPTVDVVDLLMSFGEVALRFLMLLLLIGLFGRLEHLIYETLESVVVPSLVLSLGMENVNAIQEAFKFTRPRPILIVASQPLYIVHGVIRLPLLVVTLG